MAANELQNRHCIVTMFSMFPHILENIFFFLDYESYKVCMQVNSEWREQLSSERYKTWVKSVFKREILEDENKLCAAADEDNIDGVRRLLSSGIINVNCVDALDCLDDTFDIYESYTR